VNNNLSDHIIHMSDMDHLMEHDLMERQKHYSEWKWFWSWCLFL